MINNDSIQKIFFEQTNINKNKKLNKCFIDSKGIVKGIY